MSDSMSEEKSWVPHDNRAAVIGYYTAFFSFIPITGILTGAIAVYFGVRGRKWAAAHEGAGGGHSLFALIAGGIFFVLQCAFVLYPLLTGI